MQVPEQYRRIRVQPGEYTVSATAVPNGPALPLPKKNPKPVHRLPMDPDRRPMWYYNAFGGVRNSDVYPEENRYGCHPTWRGPEGPENFINRHIRPAQEAGCDRVFLNRPAGTSGNWVVSFASWHAMPPAKREAMVRLIHDYTLDEAPRPLDICYYIGSYVSDYRDVFPQSPYNPEYTSDRWTFDSSDPYSLAAIRASLGGLMAGGMTTLGLDASTPWGQTAVDFAHQLAQPPFRMRTIGEAVPIIKNDEGRPIRDDEGFTVPDMDLIEQMPHLALLRYLASRFNPNREFDPQRTELYIWLTGEGWNGKNAPDTDDGRSDVMWAWMNRGFIPIVHGQRWVEEAANNAVKLNWI